MVWVLGLFTSSGTRNVESRISRGLLRNFACMMPHRLSRWFSSYTEEPMILWSHFINSSISKAAYAYLVTIHLRTMEVKAIPGMWSGDYGLWEAETSIFQKKGYRSWLKAFKMEFYILLHKCVFAMKSVFDFCGKAQNSWKQMKNSVVFLKFGPWIDLL